MADLPRCNRGFFRPLPSASIAERRFGSLLTRAPLPWDVSRETPQSQYLCLSALDGLDPPFSACFSSALQFELMVSRETSTIFISQALVDQHRHSKSLSPGPRSDRSGQRLSPAELLKGRSGTSEILSLHPHGRSSVWGSTSSSFSFNTHTSRLFLAQLDGLMRGRNNRECIRGLILRRPPSGACD